MKNIILFDPETRDQLLPLSFTRPVCELRVGILTIREKWERLLQTTASFITQDYLTDKFPITIGTDNFVINGSVLPTESLCRLIDQLGNNEALLKKGDLIAARLDEYQFMNLMNETEIEELAGFEIEDPDFIQIDHTWDIVKYNGEALAADFALITKGRASLPLDPSNRLIGDPAKLFIEPGAQILCSILNTTTGPIYIGKDAEIMEGCMVRGSFALCEHSTLKMGAKIYSATTIGPHSKVGGEVGNAVVMGYSNKAHDGFLGASVLGEWCNMGADSNTSNLKNNYEEVKIWDYSKKSFVKTGMQFLGLIMGDHSKCSINTMFNTGTVIGISSNIYGTGFPRNFVPSFSWGGAEGYQTYMLDKACATAERVMSRRNIPFTKEDRDILQHVFEQSSGFRQWEKKSLNLNIKPQEAM